ncbi:unnamed protein product [Rhizoctonia solani]|uniref:Uncharacterized protein n=1 Tax=Rhizoctonia solani TaxID=456999 RepID=A0A8H3DBX6_9AGAM|nr:unnamed protein product [Rhizoctonia solani]
MLERRSLGRRESRDNCLLLSIAGSNHHINHISKHNPNKLCHTFIPDNNPLWPDPQDLAFIPTLPASLIDSLQRHLVRRCGFSSSTVQSKMDRNYLAHTHGKLMVTVTAMHMVMDITRIWQ